MPQYYLLRHFCAVFHDARGALAPPATRAMTVDRMAPFATFGAHDMEELYQKIGEIHDHKGYIAASLKPGGVQVGSKPRFLIRLLLPKGTNAAAISKFSVILSEEEILIIRGGKPKLNRIVDEGDKKVVLVKYLGAEQ